MPISMHIEGYYRITVDEDDMRGTYIAHVDEALDPEDPDSTQIEVDVRGEADDDWATCSMTCTLGEFFCHFEAREIGYYRTGDGVF
ncbi:MAG: hypothetical protein Tp1123DCM257201_53 [Prokaryotic dsDNA virus sp.]|nr:MAG: hypothetical protein Tp1123DCM257201_53 [Prokaryotic dsDNA virus sp.]|tara:strand:+ start:9598 stop:9855 length:258 start_codon:yes stop_codon:yes gene_type:complete